MSALRAWTGRWNRALAAHLLQRAGFGATPAELNRAVAAGMDKTVEALLEFGDRADAPATVHDIESVRAWWVERMLDGRQPLREKLTLFWHGHFATSVRDGGNARHMFIQNEFLRKNCLGNFRELLLGISRDPAMLRFLNNDTNHKRRPNENYARELMELFSMGVGHYTETDVKAAARAFTGWTVRGDAFFFNAADHDDGVKTFLGVTGPLDGADIVDIILRQPCTARFIAAKLLRFFVADPPDPSVVEEAAALLRDHRYELKPLLRAIFRSEYFYSPAAYRAQIKSPAQLVVGSVRALELPAEPSALAAAMRNLGQDLFAPPTVKGWDGGEAWINTTTLLLRYNFAGDLIEGHLTAASPAAPTRMSGGRPRPQKPPKPTRPLNRLYGPDIAADAPRLVDALAGRLLQAWLEPTARQWLIAQADTLRVSERPAAIAHLIMSMPDYQLC
jgi:uncharacterized protein (DUF1800 family)